jgi:hypothetical protein
MVFKEQHPRGTGCRVSPNIKLHLLNRQRLTVLSQNTPSKGVGKDEKFGAVLMAR